VPTTSRVGSRTWSGELAEPAPRMSTDDVSNRPFPPLLTEEQRRTVLRRALVNALRSGRHFALVDADAGTTQRPAPEITATVAIIALLWALGATVGDQLGLAVWWWVPVAIGIFLGVALLAQFRPLAPALGFLVLLAVPVTLVAEVGGPHVLLTHVLPAIVVAAAALVTRSVDVRSARDVGVAASAVARSAPLLAPLVLVVLVLPALSADLWQAAAKLDAVDVGIFLAVTVIPLGLLVMRQLLAELPTVLDARAKALTEDPRRDDHTRDMLRERLDRETFELVEAASSASVANAWPDHAEEYLRVIAASESTTLHRPLQGRLAVCVIVVGVALSTYLYVVLATLVDPNVAHDWSNESVPVWHINLIGAEVSFPGGIYVRVVVMLGTLATATFLAFALLEERFSNALGDALLRLPADRLLALALPYLRLREERIDSQDDVLDEWDPGAIMKEEQPTAEPTNQR
jgi:hypothetical protein